MKLLCGFYVLFRTLLKERHHALGDEENTSADGAVTNYMNQAIEGQEQILSGDVCNKWTLHFIDPKDEKKYTELVVKNTHGTFIPLSKIRI